MVFVGLYPLVSGLYWIAGALVFAVHRERRPRGFLLWNRFGHLDAARELIQAGEPVGQHVRVG